MKTFDNTYFSIQETSIYKGIAILMIVIHNYLHIVPGFGLENEAGFNASNVRKFIHYLYPLRWYESFNAIAGFLGHYGVQLFIFFSAYGLTVQMMKSKQEESYLSYLWRRLKKLYFLMFFGIVVFLFINFFSSGSFYGFRRIVKETLLLATSVSNFNNSTLYKSFSGPFWFFGLMVQLYLVFPLLFRIVKKYNIYIIVVLVFIAISLLYVVDRKNDFSVFGNLIGHLPEVLLGIYFAQKGLKKSNLLVFIGSLALFSVSQLFGTVFPLSFLAITLILLYVIGMAMPYLKDIPKRILIYIGEISMILFVVNGPLRLLPFFHNLEAELRSERIFLFLICLFTISHLLYKVYVFLAKKVNI